MKLKNALKKKGQLIKESIHFDTQLQKYNCVPVENADNRAYDPRETLAKWLEKLNEIVDLKTKIYHANLPVYDKIVRMAELKGVVKRLLYLNCHSGILTDESYQKTNTYVSVISVKERDDLIQKFEDEIALLQDELDEYNAKTELP